MCRHSKSSCTNFCAGPGEQLVRHAVLPVECSRFSRVLANYRWKWSRRWGLAIGVVSALAGAGAVARTGGGARAGRGRRLRPCTCGGRRRAHGGAAAAATTATAAGDRSAAAEYVRGVPLAGRAGTGRATANAASAFDRSRGRRCRPSASRAARAARHVATARAPNVCFFFFRLKCLEILSCTIHCARTALYSTVLCSIQHILIEGIHLRTHRPVLNRIPYHSICNAVGTLHIWTVSLPKTCSSSALRAASSCDEASPRAPEPNSPSLFGMHCTVRLQYILHYITYLSFYSSHSIQKRSAYSSYNFVFVFVFLSSFIIQ